MAPMKRSANGSWIDQNKNRIVDMENLWDSRSPYGTDLNLCTGFRANDCKYYADTCKSETCFICAWANTPIFTLRGHCTNTHIEREFVLLPEKTFDGNLFFFGIEKYNMIFNQETSSWLIVKNGIKELLKSGKISTVSLDIVGAFKPDKSNDHHLPVGTHFWNLTENCNQVVQLKLTQVRKK